MQNLSVTLVQANQIWEDKEANFRNYERLLESVNASDIIVLPEMFHTGFTMHAVQLAEKMESSNSIEWLKKLASKKNTAIYTSLIIEDGTNFYNRGVFVFPTGELEIYDKRKTFGLAGEDKVYTAGDHSAIVHYKGWNINLQICYDLRFPEISLNKMIDNSPLYDLSIYVANWPEKRSPHWNALLVARAIENQSFVIGVNRVGEDKNKLNYSGDSQTVDPLGEINKLHPIESVKNIVLESKKLIETREKLPFIKDRIC